jgi:acetoacetate decarboxylase
MNKEREMKAADVRKTAFAMPRHSPSYPPGPYRFVGREYMTITYRTDETRLRAIVPEPLEPIDGLVHLEFVRMPDSTGFGAYNGAAQVIPVRLHGEEGAYTRLMFLDIHPPIAGGRELWGFPQKLASPSLRVERDTLVGLLDFGPVRVASGSMGYKHRVVKSEDVAARFSQPGFLLKVFPHVDGSPRICELVRYTKGGLTIRGAWTGPAALELHPHALAPLTDLPIREIVSGVNFVADYTLELGSVVHDYLA